MEFAGHGNRTNCPCPTAWFGMAARQRLHCTGGVSHKGEDMAYRKIEAGRGWDWYQEGWSWLMRAPLLIFSQVLVIFVLMLLAGLVPLLGHLAAMLFGPVLVAGVYYTLQRLETGDEAPFELLFEGFRRQFKDLVILGLILLAAQMVLAMLVLMAIGGSLLGAGGMAWSAGGAELDPVAAILGAGAAAILLFLLLIVPLAMAFFFATPLIALASSDAIGALRLSFNAVLANWPASLVYVLLYLIFAMLATLTFGLGWLLLAPLMFTSSFAAFREVFPSPPPAADAS